MNPVELFATVECHCTGTAVRRRHLAVKRGGRAVGFSTFRLPSPGPTRLFERWIMPNPLRPLLTVLRALRERINDLPVAGEEYAFASEPERAKALIYLDVLNLAYTTKKSLKQTYSAPFDPPVIDSDGETLMSVVPPRRVLACFDRLVRQSG